MAPVTEFAVIPLKAGTTLDPSTPAGQTLSTTIDTVSQQAGFQSAYYGLEMENQNTLRLFINWDSLDAHMAFTKKPEYGPFMKNLGSVIDGDPKLYHAAMQPHPPKALTPTVAPTTEVLIGYFDPSITDSDQKTFESNAQKLFDVLAKSAPSNGFRGETNHGWVHEPLERDGKTTKAFVGAVAWDSKDAHMKFRDTQEFKDNIHLIRDVKGLVGFEMFHVQNAERGESAAAPLGAQEEVLNPMAGVKNPPDTTSEGMSTKYTK